MPRLNCNLIWLTVIVSVLCYSQVNQNAYGRYFVDAMQTIHYFGLEDVDEQQLFNAAMQGMAREHDRYSSFVSRDLKQRYENALDQEFGGIGTHVELDPDGRGIRVISAMVGWPRPAFDAGIRTGDLIVGINGESIVGQPLTESVMKIRGAEDTYVELSVIHEGESEPREIRVKRSRIKIDAVVGDVRDEEGQWDYRLAADPRIAYIRITSFSERTASEVREVLAKLKGNGQLRALILDLRDNPGGYLRAAWETCDLFIPGGVIVTTRGRGGALETEYRAESEGTFEGFPIAVLVNNESASASEIVAACLQDYDRAVVIGVRTFGKGSVQQMIPMEQGRSILKLTTLSYWRPSGKNIHRLRNATEEDDWGVRPDEGFEVELTDEQDRERREIRSRREAFQPDRGDVVEGSIPEVDLQLQKAVQYLQSALSQ